MLAIICLLITFLIIRYIYKKHTESDLEKTLVEFKLDPETQKYKMENIEVKLLGL